MAITRRGGESRLAATTLPHFGSLRAHTYASDGKERQLQEPSTLLQHICNEIKQMCHIMTGRPAGFLARQTAGIYSGRFCFFRPTGVTCFTY